MKVHDLIKILKRKFDLNDDVVIAWWDYEDTVEALDLEDNEELSKDDFSDFAAFLDDGLEWNHISENFRSIYNYWKD